MPLPLEGWMVGGMGGGGCVQANNRLRRTSVCVTDCALLHCAAQGSQDHLVHLGVASEGDPEAAGAVVVEVVVPEVELLEHAVPFEPLGEPNGPGIPHKVLLQPKHHLSGRAERPPGQAGGRKTDAHSEK